MRWGQGSGRWAAWTVAWTLAGCTLWGGPRTLDITPAQLERAIDRPFPMTRQFLDVFDVRIAPPHLTLQPDAGQLTTEFELELTQRITQGTHRGRFALSHGVRFEPSDQTVRLTHPKLVRIEVDGATVLFEHPLERFGLALAEQLFDDRVVYTLSSHDLEQLHARGLRPAELHVSPAGLTLTLVPLEPA